MGRGVYRLVHGDLRKDEVKVKVMKVTITRKSRGLGYGSTSEVEQGPGGLRIKDVKSPDLSGLSPRAACDAHQQAWRMNQGHSWRAAFFWKGKKIKSSDVLWELELLANGGNPIEVEVEG